MARMKSANENMKIMKIIMAWQYENGVKIMRICGNGGIK
jgi:hypothetical protein